MWMGRLEAPSPATVWAAPAADRATAPNTGTNRMSAVAPRHRADRVAGFLCAFSFALSGIAIARTPALLATSAIMLALVAARMTETHRRLASVAVFIGASAFVGGMAVAVVTDNGIY